MVSLLVAVIVMALVFDYINGFHDAANAIATVVSTGVLPIRTAVLIAGVLNFVGAVAGTAVAKTIAAGFTDPALVTQTVVLAALTGASIWNLLTWWFGIPSSSSHALIAGLAGAVVAHANLGAFRWDSLVKKVLIPLVASPLIGFVVAFGVMVGLLWGLRRVKPAVVHRESRRLQLLSASLMAFSHGSNDAQKAMGIITLALSAFVLSGHATPAWMPDAMFPASNDAVPVWVILACATAIALGTMAGGVRIIKTMGTKIIRISPLQGFAAETAGAMTILTASNLGIPVSTTHCINACIMGVGASKRVSAVRWGVATNILVAWVLTLPASAALAWASMKLLDLIFHKGSRMAFIPPRTPPGVMELLPKQQIAFQRMLDTIRRGYERFGFLPVETPVFELTDVLLTKSGGETEKQVYFVQSTGNRQQGREPDLALRFDLTVPLARYVAEHEPQLTFPFRRYQIQRVYRGERAQKGRYREFYQCDVDVIGKDALDVAYDAELPALIHQVFTDLNVGEFQINLSNRKVLQGLLRALGVDDPQRRMAVLREIDKLEKMGREKVEANLRGPELGLSEDVTRRLVEAVELKGSNEELLAGLEASGVTDEAFTAGVAELRTVVRALKALGVPEQRARVNLAIARGLDYYTGTVYETQLLGRPEFGSVCSGGRYEDLASHYTKSRLPGVGISIGATRLFSALLEAGVIATDQTTAQVFVCQLSPELMPDCFALAAELRGAGLNTELQMEATKVARQLKYADRQGVSVVVMLGGDEKAAGAVTLKDLRSGTQQRVPREKLVDTVRSLLQGAPTVSP